MRLLIIERLRGSLTALALAALSLFVGAAHAQTNVRIVASNLTSGNNQEYITAGSNILKAMNADVIAIQEFNIPGGNGTTQVNNWVTSTFGAGYVWAREPITSGINIPNGVVSRYPILASGTFDDTEVPDRNHFWARIDIPGSIDLYVVSVHLSSGGGSSVRANQANDIMSTMLPGLSIPAGSYVAIAGDLNTNSRTEAAINTFGSTSFANRMVVSSPFPADQNNNGNTNANRNNPYDWVMANTTLDALEVATTYGAFTFTNGMVFDSRTFSQTQLNSNFPPVQTGDSGDTNMQHMAVVRTFAVPSGTNDYSVAPTSVAFGTVNATAGPFNNSSSTISVTNPFTISSVTISGTSASEFAVTSPTIPGTVSVNTPINIRWTPVANDGVTRSVTALFTTTGTPSSFSLSITGTTQSAGGGGSTLDVSGYRVEQLNSAQTYTIAAGTPAIPAGGFVVIGRNVSRTAFETAWGVTLAPNVTYFNSANSFPLINGGEQFRILNAALNPVDPSSGHLPTTAITANLIYRRDSTAASSFTSASASVTTNASPGTYAGTRGNTGRLIITEIADAATFDNEFIELFYDASASVEDWSAY